MFSGFFKDPLDFSLPLAFEIDPFFKVPLRSSLIPPPSIPPPLIPTQRRNKSGKVNVPVSSIKEYKVMFDLKQFHSDDVTVKVLDGDTVEVHAKHEEKADEHGFISREFTRRLKLPSDVNSKELHVSMSLDGILMISVPYKDQDMPVNERVVPIKVVDSAVAWSGAVLPRKKVEVPVQKKKVEPVAVAVKCGDVPTSQDEVEPAAASLEEVEPVAVAVKCGDVPTSQDEVEPAAASQEEVEHVAVAVAVKCGDVPTSQDEVEPAAASKEEAEPVAQ